MKNEGEFTMISKPTKTILFDLVLCTAWTLSASAAFAGEITGNGETITRHGASECVYSGRQDDPVGDAGLFKGDRTQNWGQLTDFGRWVFAEVFGITSPGQGCNPTWGG